MEEGGGGGWAGAGGGGVGGVEGEVGEGDGRIEEGGWKRVRGVEGRRETRSVGK